MWDYLLDYTLFFKYNFQYLTNNSSFKNIWQNYQKKAVLIPLY